MSKNTAPGAKMLDGRIADLIRTSEYIVKTSSFLTPAEQKAAFDTARSAGAADRCFFWGGAAGCERRVAVFLPEWMISESSLSGGAFDPSREEIILEELKSGALDLSDSVFALEISGSAYSELSHRDYLGALIALGLERDSVGDIVTTSKSGAVVFIKEAVRRAVEEELSSVGKERVSVRAADLPAGFRIEREFEAITDTVMSPRLDGIVKALCGVTREAVSDLVEKGDVQLNYTVTVKTDATVEKGDIISVRGYGKYVYDGDRGVNRRGRLRIDARKYI